MVMKSNGTFRNADDSRSVDVSRRKFLAASAVGVAGLGAVGSAAAAPEEHTLVISGTGPSTSYSFTVGGNLEKSTAEGASISSSDEIVGNSAHGGVGNGKDAYTFTGPLYSFDFDQSGAIDVDLDGEAARVGQRPDHTLVIEGTGENAEYSFATKSRPLVSRAYGASINQSDKRNEYGAAGSVQSGKDAYKYDGDLLAFDLDGEAEVTIDGKPAYVAARPDEVITVVGNGSSRTEYAIEFDGRYREAVDLDNDQDGLHQDYFDLFNEDEMSTFEGVVSGTEQDRFAINGDTKTLVHNPGNRPAVYANYEQIHEAELD